MMALKNYSLRRGVGDFSEVCPHSDLTRRDRQAADAQALKLADWAELTAGADVESKER